MSTILEPVQHPVPGQPSRQGELALSLQEAFTVAVRLRAGRQVAADATSFRGHIKQLLAAADHRARSVGYDGDTVKLAVYAYIALLDESVLNSANPMFADWSRQPLQEEVFGEHMAGENFFRTAQDLLGRQDSEGLADLLEVYQLCLLIGFHGRYGASDAAGVNTVNAAIAAKIARIRGDGAGSLELAPDWRLPLAEQLTGGADIWARRLKLIALVALGLAVVLFIMFRLALASPMGDLDRLI